MQKSRELFNIFVLDMWGDMKNSILTMTLFLVKKN